MSSDLLFTMTTSNKTNIMLGYPTVRWASFFKERDDLGIIMDHAGNEWSTDVCRKNYRAPGIAEFKEKKRQWLFGNDKRAFLVCRYGIPGYQPQQSIAMIDQEDDDHAVLRMRYCDEHDDYDDESGEGLKKALEWSAFVHCRDITHSTRYDENDDDNTIVS